ncbi:MAG TPA: hypothetical protein DDX51_07480 [Clostridiales bacterium]|nr:hypothetical protein [Clostridiales bacterium]
MTSYSVSCGIYATDNDHLKLAELRVPEQDVPQFITGLRALLTGAIEMLRLCDAKQKAVITGKGQTTFPLVFENGSTAYLCEENLYEMEEFALARLFGQKKPNACLTLQLAGEDDLQLSVGLWIGDKK